MDMYRMGQKIVVSIICITYNHEAYIRDTIDGFLMQETDFPFEVLIHDDASIDQTAEIVKEYEKKNPDVIRVIYERENQYSRGVNIIKDLIFPLCRGKYIALCEGDDCWIDAQKLQLQVDYMESHLDCIMYLHNALWMDYKTYRLKPGNPFELDTLKKERGRRLSAGEVIIQKNAHPPTASFLFRRELYDIDKFFFYGRGGDYRLLLAALMKGYIYYSGRVMSIYRYQIEGSSTDRLCKDLHFFVYFQIGILEFLCRYDKHSKYKFHEYLVWVMQMWAYSLLERVEEAESDICQLINKCEEKGYLFGMVYNINIIKYELKRLHQQISNDMYISDETRKFLGENRNIWIMGVGKFATLLANQFNNNNIDFEGFAVTNPQEGQKVYMGKNVRKLQEIAQEDRDFGLIIGIMPSQKQKVRESLIEAGVKNYINPFEFKIL